MAEKKLEDKRGDNGKAGYVDEHGNWVIEPKFDDTWDFADGIAKVKLKGKYGFIKTDGTYLVEPMFDDAFDFQDDEAFVLYEGKYRILMADGLFKKLSQEEDYILNCRRMNNTHFGWSFLEATKKEGNWVFDSWARIMQDNEEWYDACRDGIEEGDEVVRYYDEVEQNKEFANWATSLNLSSDEEIGKLLWCNALQLTDAITQKLWEDGMERFTLWIQLYNQLENIKEIGQFDLRKSLNLPEVENLYLDPSEIRKKAEEWNEEDLNEEDSFENVDFSELLKHSKKPGDYSYISNYDFEIIEEEDDDE